MTKPIVTKQMLIDAKACGHQVNLFEKTFGDSVVVTIKRAEKVAHLFQWDWAIRLLDTQGRAEYSCGIEAARAELKRAKAPARDKYIRVIAAAAAEYRRVGGGVTARNKYSRVIAASRAEYSRVEAPAFVKFNRVIATAWATAFIDMHKRGAKQMTNISE
jgi:hypothetical protein